MSIVLNEIKWAQELNDSRKPELGYKPFESLSRMAKYYKSEGYTKSEARSALDVFLIRCMPDANIVSWSDTLDRATKNGFKFAPIVLEYIGVSKSEMDKVDALRFKQLRRLAFTLLCLAKYWNNFKSNNRNWVRTSDSDIMKMANIKVSVKRQCELFRELNNQGYIKFSKQVDNLNVQVMFIDNEEPVLKVYDMDNLGYQYIMYHGDPWFYECKACGKVAKRKNLKSRPPKYCGNCADNLARQARIESVRRIRMNIPS